MQEPVRTDMGLSLGAPEQPTLVAAYDLCETITRQYSKSFYMATLLLPSAKRQAIRALYAFCRRSDNIVDEPSSSPQIVLDRWVTQSRTNGPTDDLVLIAWHDLCARYSLSTQVIDDLLAGIRMDLTINRYASFDDLWLYCYRVAGTVGLLSMQIIGCAAGAEPYAIKLGVALQLTNILRDVGEDAGRGRIYLPQDELATYGVTESDVLTGRNHERWQALMRFQIERNRQLYQAAWPGIALLHADGRYAVATAATLYRAILTKIEANGYDNFRRRAHLSSLEKLSMLPGILWRTWRCKRC